MNRYNLSNINAFFELRESIFENDYHNCELVVNDFVYNVIKSFENSVFKNLKEILEQRKITLLKET